MDLAGYVINAVLVEGRSVAEGRCRARHVPVVGCTSCWHANRASGEEGTEAQRFHVDRGPLRRGVSAEMEAEIIARRARPWSREEGVGCRRLDDPPPPGGPLPAKEEGGALVGHHLGGC